MSTTTATVAFYNKFILNLCKEINLDSDTLVMGLCTSGYTPDASNHETLSDITNEVSAGGYTRQTLSNVTLVENAGVITLDFDNPIFIANTADFTARRFFIFDDSVATPNKPLIAFGLLDQANLDVTVTWGNQLEVVLDPSGLITVQ